MQNQIDRIRSFIAVVDTGSFTQAAKYLRLSKSMVSIHIKALETELDASLLNRNTRRFSLTETGEMLYQDFRLVLSQLEQTLDKARLGHQELQGSLRLSSTAEFGEHYILPLLNQFMQLHPKLKVQYAFNSSIEDLINHKLDLAIRLGTLKDSNYRSTKLADYEISLVISPDLLQKFSIKTIDELSTIPYLANSNLRQSKLSSSSEFNTLLSQLAQDAYFETNTIVALKKMVLAHSGMTILPHWYIQQELLEKKLVVLFPDVSLLTQSVNIIFPYSEYIPRKTRLFIDYLKENIQL
ncbi:LysR family transcriptional regulator [Proteus terrae]|uniref:LysR family transcriptional regulator n=1 Tax=Proteus terrae TaxID=1574161 RepID=UPI0013305AC2|nr:LysR family transcriptional regulator [Proteus terrae]QKD70163.1 LysR family transcriptional regulator [Proteus terrae subsp. cibarius]QKD71991.1 LysR family transcriptional regulator [Proteus terrae subsp. cibarius]QUT02887.1 LysR family transcriptional regulator [Proteus terrae subsp. cibarius]UDF26935.1 LysR family transcriptional regulator [Proteus terrae subsp. cibarius]WCG87839.1 LysR family transcriptional regulator [Proteus terrae]